MTLPLDEIPDRPTVDRWSPDDFTTHCAAEGVELHARPRFGGPPVLGVAVVGAVANAVLQASEQHEGIDL
jgi:hypothetical protein